MQNPAKHLLVLDMHTVDLQSIPYLPEYQRRMYLKGNDERVWGNFLWLPQYANTDYQEMVESGSADPEFRNR